MIGYLDDSFPPAVTKTTLYRIVGWILQVYVASLLIVGVYSLLWILEVAGMLPGAGCRRCGSASPRPASSSSSFSFPSITWLERPIADPESVVDRVVCARPPGRTELSADLSPRRSDQRVRIPP